MLLLRLRVLLLRPLLPLKAPRALLRPQPKELQLQLQQQLRRAMGLRLPPQLPQTRLLKART